MTRINDQDQDSLKKEECNRVDNNDSEKKANEKN